MYAFKNTFQQILYFLLMILEIPYYIIRGGISEVACEIVNYNWLCENTKRNKEFNKL